MKLICKVRILNQIRKRVVIILLVNYCIISKDWLLTYIFTSRVVSSRPLLTLERVRFEESLRSRRRWPVVAYQITSRTKNRAEFREQSLAYVWPNDTC